MKEAVKNFKDPLTTELKALDKFYIAEVYHQDYFETIFRVFELLSEPNQSS